MSCPGMASCEGKLNIRKPVWCHDCPILEHCPHRQAKASIYFATHEARMRTRDDERTDRMKKLMKVAVENCPLLKLFPLFERMSVES